MFESVNGPERLKKLRLEKCFTLRELGERTGISPTLLCRVEKGERTLEPQELLTICDVFELSKEEKDSLLFGFGFFELE